jgi:hypothetical protein
VENNGNHNDDASEYWDPKEFVRDDVITDWEGFTSPEEMSQHIGWIRRLVTDHPESPAVSFVADLTLHWVHENMDQADNSPTEAETIEMYYAILNVFDGGSFMKSGIDWRGEAPSNSTIEDA